MTMEILAPLLDYGIMGVLVAVVYFGARYMQRREAFLEDLVKTTMAEKNTQIIAWHTAVTEMTKASEQTNGNLQAQEAVLRKLCNQMEKHDERIMTKLEAV